MRWGVLCAGIGGVEFGLHDAGHCAAWAVEYDPDPTHGDQVAAHYHRLNHPDTLLINQDLRDVDVQELANIDALWGSFPCQGFSIGRDASLPPREDIWIGRDILRYVTELQPRVVTIENVPRYAKHPVCREIVAGLFEMGYAVQRRILNCADYGIPQSRERLIIQARRDGRILWPTKHRQRMGWYAAIADLIPMLPVKDGLPSWVSDRWDEAYDRLRPVFIDAQFAYSRNPNQQRRLLTVRAADEPVPTVVASHNQTQKLLLLEDETLRTTPPRANARWQTFPDSVILPPFLKDANRLIGNAVPPTLARLLAECAEAGADVWQGSLFEMEAA